MGGGGVQGWSWPLRWDQCKCKDGQEVDDGNDENDSGVLFSWLKNKQATVGAA